MMCFITGKYSKTAPAGGMLGYVMDGDLEKAARGISEAIRDRSGGLKLAAGGEYHISALMPLHKWNGETHHRRQTGLLVIYHVLLSIRKVRP
jgi:hypothetical protein